MDKRFLAIVGVIIILFVGFVFIRNSNEPASSNSDAQPTNHVKGEGTDVTLLEYGDFQCPACGQYYPVMQQVYDKYSDEIKFQFRHFPITSAHPNAFGASRAAEAASKQGKFWEMYDKLFAGQMEWSNSQNPNAVFEQYAKLIELDVERYKTDFKSDVVNDAINADMAEARKINVTGTPTFVLNGKKLEETPQATLEDFSKLIDAELAKAKAESEE